MKEVGVYICPRPRDSGWELEIPPNSKEFLLIGWSVRPKPVDGGAPEEIATLLASTMTSIAEVSFMCRTSEIEYKLSPLDHIQKIKKQSLMDFISAKYRDFWRDSALVTTGSFKTAENLFDSVGFNWGMKGQIVLLSKAGSRSLDLPYKIINKLFDLKWYEQVRSLESLDVLGALRPGVDGDVAVLFSHSPDFEKLFRAALLKNTKEMNMKFEEVSEEKFADRLAAS